MRRLGIDPGSAYLAATIIDGNAVPCAYVDALTREVGRMVLRDAPRPLFAKDGSPRLNSDGNPVILTHRRAPPSDEDAEIIAREVTTWAVSHGVERAAVEEVTDVHFAPTMGDAGKSSVAGALVRSGKVGAIVAMRLRDAGIHVERVKHATWAGRIAKSARVKPKQVKPIIVAAVTGWPAQTNEHERDAAGCALWDVVVAAEAEAARMAPCRVCNRPMGEHTDANRATCAASKAPRRRVSRTQGPSAKVRAMREERSAAGCACAKRHKKTCVLYVKGTITCRKCKGPATGHLRGLPCPAFVTDASSSTR